MQVLFKELVLSKITDEEVEAAAYAHGSKDMPLKRFFSGVKLFIFDEPTAGIDNGSKVEVYNMMNEIVLNNGAIILISSDFSELMGMSDKILGVYKGCQVLDMKREEFNLEKILYCITGEKN